MPIPSVTEASIETGLWGFLGQLDDVIGAKEPLIEEERGGEGLELQFPVPQSAAASQTNFSIWDEILLPDEDPPRHGIWDDILLPLEIVATSLAAQQVLIKAAPFVRSALSGGRALAQAGVYGVGLGLLMGAGLYYLQNKEPRSVLA